MDCLSWKLRFRLLYETSERKESSKNITRFLDTTWGIFSKDLWCKVHHWKDSRIQWKLEKIWGNVTSNFPHNFPNYSQIERFGNAHQAGSDSVFTLDVFIALKNGKYADQLVLKEECLIYGLTGGDYKNFYVKEFSP